MCEEMRVLERFYMVLLLCLNPMKTRSHLNPASILYKYLSLYFPPLKTLRFILDKFLTPKPPLKEPICPQWTSKPPQISTRPLIMIQTLDLPHLLYQLPNPLTRAPDHLPLHLFLYFIHFDYWLKERNTIQTRTWPQSQ